MTASITITLSDELLKALHEERSITIELDSSSGAGRQPARAGKAGGRASGDGGFRAGSLPGRLVQWAQGRKKPFGVRDVMKALKIKRAHASMVLTRVTAGGGLRRVGRGTYAAA
ncbi:MAG TPA: hypothetical protein VFY93_09475 [Planctomycetota bacterium]|nr:hypothetical protein [Planctomycetota bacterium]